MDAGQIQVTMPFSVMVSPELGPFKEDTGYWVVAVRLDRHGVPLFLVGDEENTLHWLKTEECKVGMVVAPQLASSSAPVADSSQDGARPETRRARRAVTNRDDLQHD